MYVHVPVIVPHSSSSSRVVNKTIVYSDTVLPVKELGDNLKVTSVSNVEHYSLESCLKKIFESNPEVIFNTIQYSRSDKTVYFYTNKAISTKAYEDSKVFKYKPLTTSSEILEEIKHVLTSEKNFDPNCVSLNHVVSLLNRNHKKIEKIEDKYKKLLKKDETKFNDSSFIIYGLDYKTEELRIGFKYWYKKFADDWDEIVFSKLNGDLYIKSSKSYYSQEILNVLGDELSKLYDELMEFKDYNEQKHYDFSAIKSNFKIDISEHGVSIYVDSPSSLFEKDFKLSFSNNTCKYDCYCNSHNVTSVVNGNEREIFKSVFVKIEDCPKWMHKDLFEIRRNELEEQRILELQRWEEERRLELERIQIAKKMQEKEERKQKRLELVRKIFPFIKK